MNLLALSYKTPFVILLSFAIPIIITLFIFLFLYRKKVLMILKQKQNPRSTPLFITKVILLCLTWLFATISLMQPMSSGEYIVPKGIYEQTQTQDILFLIDTSDSMRIEDTRTKQSRLEFAKEYVDAIANELQGEKIGLATFTSELTPLVPLTHNILFLRMELDEIKINQGGVAGTNFEKVLTSIVSRYFHHPLTLVIISDGEDTHLDEKDKLQKIIEVANLAKQNAIYQVTIEIGNKESPLLKKIGNLRYIANTTSPKTIAKRLKKETITVKKPPPPKLDCTLYYQIPLYLALICMIFYFLLPDVLAVFLIFAFNGPLHGNTLNEAAQFYEAEMFDRAEKIYLDLLQSEISDEERSIIQYNLATTYIASCEFKKGMVELESIENPSPWLCRFILQNLAVAIFRLAKQRQSIELFKEAINLSNDPKLIKTAKTLIADALLKKTPKDAIHLEKDAPAKTLKNGIDSLKFALHLSLTRANQLQLKKAVATTFTTITPFLQEVFTYQENQRDCQKSPWNVALPLFNRGFDSLQEGFLIRALFDWEDALLLIKEGPKKESETAQTDRVFQTLREIQEDSDDQKSEKTAIPKGEKPW